MNKSKGNVFSDSWIMFKRCLLVITRNPEGLVMATLTPFFMMILFGEIFGKVVNMGSVNYIDFIIPGIVLQSVAQASQYSAIGVTTDMTKGIIDRFRSMPISRSSVLIGHTGASIIRNILTTVVIIGTAFLIGFRPQGDFTEWVIAVGLILLVSIAFSSISVLCGLVSKTAEGSSGLMFPLFILPYVSSGFAPIDSLSGGIKWFAERQPMTPIIDSIRNLMLGVPTDNNLWVAIAWCVGISIVCFVASVYVYNHKFK